jgi:hypothetical protein
MRGARGCGSGAGRRGPRQAAPGAGAAQVRRLQVLGSRNRALARSAALERGTLTREQTRAALARVKQQGAGASTGAGGTTARAVQARGVGAGLEQQVRPRPGDS